LALTPARRPFDLAMSLGVKPGDEAHEAAIARVLAACQRAGKPAAIFCELCCLRVFSSAIADVLTGLDGADASRRRAQGFSMISIATDIDTLSTGIRAHAATALGSGSEEAGGAGGYGY
jgi:4-hydroxy-2-oxoheptanedioate aldolase